MLNGQNLPDDENGFYNLLSIYFPAFYDVKYMAREIETLKGGGLNRIAYDLNVLFHSQQNTKNSTRFVESVPNIKQAVIHYLHSQHTSN